MSPINWEPSFSVGCVELDRQHRELLNYINRMETLLLHSPCGYNRKPRVQLLRQLLTFCDNHFKLEMQLMQELGCPTDLAHSHWRSHKRFDDSVYTLYRELLGGSWVLDSTILSTLREKFFDHVLIEDKLIFQTSITADRQALPGPYLTGPRQKSVYEQERALHCQGLR